MVSNLSDLKTVFMIIFIVEVIEEIILHFFGLFLLVVSNEHSSFAFKFIKYLV